MPLDYWSFVEERALEYWSRNRKRGAQLDAGVDVLAEHAAQFSPFHVVHIAQLCLVIVVFDDCPEDLRDADGIPDLGRLVPEDHSALTVVTAAERVGALFGVGLAEALDGVEQQVAATGRGRAAAQHVLRQVPRGDAGRLVILDTVWELREDLRAVGAFVAVTTAALHAVADAARPWRK